METSTALPALPILPTVAAAPTSPAATGMASTHGDAPDQAFAKALQRAREPADDAQAAQPAEADAPAANRATPRHGVRREAAPAARETRGSPARHVPATQDMVADPKSQATASDPATRPLADLPAPDLAPLWPGPWHAAPQTIDAAPLPSTTGHPGAPAGATDTTALSAAGPDLAAPQADVPPTAQASVSSFTLHHAPHGATSDAQSPRAPFKADSAAGDTPVGAVAPLATPVTVERSAATDLVMHWAAPAIHAAPARPLVAESPNVTRTVAPPIDSPQFAPALGQQLSLLVREGAQEATLQLNPAEMGPVRVQIALEGLAARVDFHADLAATRQAIESSLPALAGALHESGLTLAGGGVFQGQGGARDEARHPSAPTTGSTARAEGDDDGLRLDPAPARLRRGLIDLVA
jgi:flagellar hook-length control protein FliK